MTDIASQHAFAPRSIARRTALRAALGALGLALALPALAQSPSGGAAKTPNPPLSARDRADVGRVEQYLNGITTLQARFLQLADNGATLQGNFYIKRPGRLRFEYDPPAHVQIVADGTQVTYYDADTDQISQMPTGLTVAKFLVAQKISLSGDLTVTQVERDAALIGLTLVRASAPGEGYVKLLLGDKPLQLRRWTVVDGRGRQISVALTDLRTGMALNDELFVFRDPDPNRASRFRP